MLEFVTVQFCNQADFFISMLTAIEFLIFSAKKSFNLKKIFKKLIINLIYIYLSIYTWSETNWFFITSWTFKYKQIKKLLNVPVSLILKFVICLNALRKCSLDERFFFFSKWLVIAFIVLISNLIHANFSVLK